MVHIDILFDVIFEFYLWCLGTSQLIHSPVGGQLSYFKVWVIINKTVTSTRMDSTSLDIPGYLELAVHQVMMLQKDQPWKRGEG